MISLRTIQAGAAALAKPDRVPGMPMHLNLEPTTFCNYHCKMCNRDLVEPMHMPFALYRGILDAVRPQRISLNGFGETFLQPDIFPMIDYAAASGIHSVTSTNGSFIARDMDRLSACALSVLRVSLDAATPETYLAIRRKPTFDDVTASVAELARRIAENGSATSLRIEFCIQESNQREIEGFVRLAARLGVRFINFQIYSEPVKDRKATVVDGFDFEALGPEMERALAASRELGVATNLRDMLANVPAIRRIYTNRAEPQKGVCIHPWVTAYVAADGDVWGCCRFVSRRQVLGNLHETPFAEIWNGERMQRLRANLKKKRDLGVVCRECQFTTLLDMVKTRVRLLPGF